MSLLGFLTACSSPSITTYQDTKPAFNLQTFFNGHIKAWGIVQDYKGEVRRRFEVEMKGSWQGEVGTLEELFVFDDGEKQKRVWTIKKISDTRYEGTAGDIIGIAQGEVAGAAMRWAYEMDLAVGKSTYRVVFDDWMYLLNDGILVNRSYIKKFGLTVGELSIFMQKQP